MTAPRRRPHKYSAELRAEVVRAVLDGRRTYAAVARQFGLAAETVRNWVTTQGRRPGDASTAPAGIGPERLAELERRVRELERQKAFLDRAVAHFTNDQPLSRRFEFIAAERDRHDNTVDVRMMCRLMDVSSSGFYEWRTRPVSAAAKRRSELTGMICTIFDESGRRFGYRRVHAELVRRGVDVDDELVRKLMRQAGLAPLPANRNHGPALPDHDP